MTRLRDERMRRGLSQFDVALQTGIHPSTLAHLEAGDVKAWPSYRRKLALLYGVSEAVLFGETAETDQR